MTANQDLFAWVKAQEKAGQVESTGVFTLEKTRAWEKLGAFALPFEEAWVLKIVQSAVSAGSGLFIEQSMAETKFSWQISPDWTHDQVESAILDPEPCPQRPLEHLAFGLRALAKSAELPFAVHYRDGTRAIWTGQGFQVDHLHPQDGSGFRLLVSHFKVGESKFILSLANIDAIRRSSAIAQTLTSRAHWAPSSTPIRLDRRCLNNVLADPVFGASELRHPLFLLQAKAQPETPPLCVQARFSPPDATFAIAPVLTGVSVGVSIDVEAAAAEWTEHPNLAIGLISAFLEKSLSGQPRVYEARTQASQLVWVTDGVEVLREELPVGRYPAALLVACSAEGLETDLTGLIPRQTEAKSRRQKLVLQAIKDRMADLSDLGSDITSFSVISKGVMLLGAAVTLAVAPIGLVVMGVGGYGMLIESTQRAKIEEVVDQGLRDLRRRLHLVKDWGDKISGTEDQGRKE